MKIAGNQHRHCHSERAERVEESEVLDFSIAGRSPTPLPLDSGLRRSDGEEAVPFSSSYVAFRKAMGNYYYENSQPPICHSRESENPGSSNVEASAKSPTPAPGFRPSPE